MTGSEAADRHDFLERHLALCAWCRREFLTAVPLRRRYCGDACRSAASRARAREQEPKR